MIGGAATYLSASKYGAGYNGVQINANGAYYSDSHGITGCGPWENGNTDSYGNSNASWIAHKNISTGTLGTQQACGKDNPQRAYNGTLGQLASTTNNPTGIYDMSGGGAEFVAASYTTNLNESGVSDFFDDYFVAKAHPPYVNTYNFKNFNFCTYQICGGQALYETNNGISTMYFVDSSHPWFVRGGDYRRGPAAGLFYSDGQAGYSNDGIASTVSRVALAPISQD